MREKCNGIGILGHSSAPSGGIPKTIRPGTLTEPPADLFLDAPPGSTCGTPVIDRIDPALEIVADPAYTWCQKSECSRASMPAYRSEDVSLGHPRLPKFRRVARKG